VGRRSLSALAALTFLTRCTLFNGPPEKTGCVQTPVSELVLSDGSKWGQRDGEVFFQTASAPGQSPYRLLRAPELMKILVILSNPLSPPTPNTIEVHGRERISGTAKTFALGQTLTTDVPYGAQWGTNFEFPVAGCWELSVDVPGNRGSIVLKVD